MEQADLGKLKGKVQHRVTVLLSGGEDYLHTSISYAL